MINYIYICVSILSVFFYVLSAQFKEKKNILSIQLLSSLCYIIVYFIKNAFTGCLIEIIELIKNYVFVRKEKRKEEISKSTLGIFLGLLLLVTFIFYDGVYSLIPLSINIILFVSSYKKNPKYIRYSMLLCGILWGIYNYFLGAYIILIGNALEVFSAIISIVRYKDFDKKS